MHWQEKGKSGHVYTRRFIWNFYPSGFFARLLVRLMHLQLVVPVSWANAAVLVNNFGDEAAFLQMLMEKDKYILEIIVHADTKSPSTHDSLTSVVPHAASILLREMYSEICDKTKQQVVVNVGDHKDCVKAIMGQSQPEISVQNNILKIEEVVPDLFQCYEVLGLEQNELLAQGGFGAVYKGKLPSIDGIKEVAVKVLLSNNNNNFAQIEAKLKEFMHEAVIMSNLLHENLVRMYGITRSPLSMVLEFVPNSDLSKIFKSTEKPSYKWCLKMAIDIATGMMYVVQVVSLDENAVCVGKIGDFGLSQHVSPFCVTVLGNYDETAPETWGDFYNLRCAVLYDEKSDIFSFAMILWRLFVGLHQQDPQASPYSSSGPMLRQEIRKGARPQMPNELDPTLSSLISSCWELLPEKRPSFPRIQSILIDLYERSCSPLVESDLQYIAKKRTVEQENGDRCTDIFAVSLKYKLPDKCNVTSLLLVEDEIWMGMNNGNLIVLSVITGAQIFVTQLTNAKVKVFIVRSSKNWIWVGLSNTIMVFHAKTKCTVMNTRLRASTNNSIINMTCFNENMWIADDKNFIYIWDITVMCKISEFKVHDSNCAQYMAVHNNYICLAVYRDLVIFHSEELKKFEYSMAHSDRISTIASVGNQLWTCSKQETLRAWEIIEEYNKVSTVQLRSIDLHLAAPLPILKVVYTLVGSSVALLGTADGRLILWDMKDNSQATTVLPSEWGIVNCITENTAHGLWFAFENGLAQYKPPKFVLGHTRIQQ